MHDSNDPVGRLLFNVLAMVAELHHTSTELAELFSVARSTVYHAIERARTAAQATTAAPLSPDP